MIILIPLISFKVILQSFVVTFAAVKAYNSEHYRYPFTISAIRLSDSILDSKERSLDVINSIATAKSEGRYCLKSLR
ncbi:DUF4870 domain-containing protein [Nostoc sp. DedQUE09]|uniref:DUF4870 domain-containing protein n=1 Tax=Nostoc sp. DedQUE09 TaxID=3075394 RepID=UPI003A0FD0D1